MNGKGDKQRPTNLEKFGKNYDKAFDKNEVIDNITKSIDVDFDNDTGAIKIRNSDGIETREKKINVIKEYVDINNVEMVIVNIDDSLTNKVMTKRQLKTLRHELINEELYENEQDAV
jgi:hypothetical protein